MLTPIPTGYSHASTEAGEPLENEVTRKYAKFLHESSHPAATLNFTDRDTEMELFLSQAKV